MALNYVTLTLDGFDGGGAALAQGAATFTPSVQLADPVDREWIPPAPVQAVFRSGLPAPTVSLLATDNANVTPAGWTWTVTFQNVPGNPASFSFFLPFSSGASQRLSAIQQTPAVTPTQAYLPLPSGAPTAGQVPVATGAGEASAWGNVSGGGMTNPMSTSGDTIYGGAAGAAQRLAGDVSNTRKFLREQSTAGVANPPAWDTIQAVDVPVLNQNTTGTAANVTGTVAIANGGTGQVTQQAALDALAGAQTANQVLAGNGTHVTLRPLAAADLPAATAGAQGAVQLDGTAADIQPPGAQTAGATGLAADAGHIHPANFWLPADNNLLAANGDPVTFTVAQLLSAGVLLLAKVQYRQATTVSKVWFGMSGTGSGASTGSFAGIYSSAGVLLSGSSDIQTTITGSVGGISVTLTTPQSIAAGSFAWHAILVNLATTQPTFTRGVGTAASIGGVGLTAATARWATSGSGQTALPASFTPSALTQSASTIWTGAS